MPSRTTGKLISLYLFFTFINTAVFTPDAGSAPSLVYLKNVSSSSATLQITDEVCKQSYDSECENARTLLQGRECVQNPLAPSCTAARGTVDSKCGCVRARNTLSSQNCRDKPLSSECSEAQDKLASSSCQEGLIFEGLVESGSKIPLSICLSPAGYGAVSVKDVRNSYWKTYRLISPGDTLSYP